MDKKLIRTRFAPSPTGALHIGSLRSALYPFLLARQHGGQFILRIEDTDQQRLVPGSIEQIIESLAWAGITYDEGPMLVDGQIVERGSYGPYIQTKRQALYQKYAEQLVAAGQAYYAFETAEELEQMRTAQAAKKLPPRYDNRGRLVTIEEAQQRRLDGEAAVIRFRVPDQASIRTNDVLRGDIDWRLSELEDFVILKSDGLPTYHLASVVDDHLMEITYIIRGEEWLPSLPKHIALYQALGWDAPIFVHLPLLLNKDKTKLSKRQNAVAVTDYQAAGYLSAAVVNYVLMLGWNPGTDQEIFSQIEMIASFSLEHLHKAGAVFDPDKLQWYNQQYMQRLSDNDYRAAIQPFIGGILEKFDVAMVDRFAVIFRPRLKVLNELADFIRVILDSTVTKDDLRTMVIGKNEATTVARSLGVARQALSALSADDWSVVSIERVLREVMQVENLSGGVFLGPLRVALSGLAQSPTPFELAWAWGPALTIQKIEAAEVLL